MYPHQVWEIDSDGNSPLHLYSGSCKANILLEENHDERQAAAKMLQSLVKVHPKAARYPNFQGKLPLHLAVTLGRKSWHCDGLKFLFEANPSAIYECDQDTKLLPFMLASIGHMSPLCSSFELLRELPELEQHLRSGYAQSPVKSR